MKEKPLSRREFLRGSAVTVGATATVIGSGLLGATEVLAQESEGKMALPKTLEHRQAVAVRDSNWATFMSKIGEEI
ncbi:MAG TPA: twin-arginine translocation signal domain-containing protein [Thiolapillus brandeum]|uniref:Twin-arginine translocation signal domain-containing protein n=1 Tax=Thiolapillus brandeum TaxID=1076588 RepID=A0A831K4K6_9GAMM|nr:twin-arginine translocation signal domain-containing protein [Thiolapillus brandeum]